MQTGDILECYGEGFVSTTIRVAQSFFALFKGDIGISPSHVAILVNKDNNLLVYESTTQSTINDYLTGIPFKGVQVHLYEDWLANYPGKVYHRPIIVPIRRCAVEKYLETVHKDKIPYDTRQALGSLFTYVNKNDSSEMYCSELAVFSLQKGEAITLKINASAISPRKFKRFKCLGKARRLK